MGVLVLAVFSFLPDRLDRETDCFSTVPRFPIQVDRMHYNTIATGDYYSFQVQDRNSSTPSQNLVLAIASSVIPLSAVSSLYSDKFVLMRYPSIRFTTTSGDGASWPVERILMAL
jgi:hypothetical protein